eukprot:gene18268-2437_t
MPGRVSSCRVVDDPALHAPRAPLLPALLSLLFTHRAPLEGPLDRGAQLDRSALPPSQGTVERGGGGGGEMRRTHGVAAAAA